ncbi:MAG: shikimate kinase [Oscillibacter sp.]|nr:shikimate kinase [Oscillibacter sp.]
MKNIVLIGMPGTGKSVVGRALAERLNFTFLDVDDVIMEAAGKKLSEILRGEGLEAFLTLEEQVGLGLDLDRTVIATGGSMVLSAAAMEHLKEDAITVWLETPISQIAERMPEDLWDRGIAADHDLDIREIYAQRKPYYNQYADLIVASREGEDSTAHQVEEVMRIVGMQL